MSLRVFSFGGGRQSTAALVLAAFGLLDVETFLFCNVGDDSENPATLTYVRDVAMPYAAAHGLTLLELAKTKPDGSPDSLLDWALRSERSVYLPLRTAGGFPGNRTCTKRFKIDQIDRWLKANGATAEDPAAVHIGISLDEFQRARTDDRRRPWAHAVYPLIERRLSRADCSRIIAQAGLPLPPKSACWFCPFHRLRDWATMQRDEPALFAQAAELEQTFSERSVGLGRPPLFLSRHGLPLVEAFRRDGQQGAFDFEGEEAEDVCESGHCFV